jgi:outer membrane lipoprotein SlyB
MGRIFSSSVAAVSFIDAKTDLPEVDEVSYTYGGSIRSSLTGNYGYRFCNFMDIYIEVDQNGKIQGSGFYPESAVYRGPSFAGIRSHAFDTLQSKMVNKESVIFRQITGARTVSPEVIGESLGTGAGVFAGGVGGFAIAGPPGAIVGGIVGGIVGYFGGQTAAHQITGFPPIWSILEIKINNTGYPEDKLVQHSIFPSVTYYAQTDSTVVRGERYARAYYYDARKELELPKWKDKGWGNFQNSSGPVGLGGNPWNISKGIRGADDDTPN